MRCDAMRLYLSSCLTVQIQYNYAVQRFKVRHCLLDCLLQSLDCALGNQLICPFHPFPAFLLMCSMVWAFCEPSLSFESSTVFTVCLKGIRVYFQAGPLLFLSPVQDQPFAVANV